MRRIAFIIESTTRQEHPMPAYEFYQSPRSRWISSIIRFMEERAFPKGDIYFLSYFGRRIIPYEDIVEPYPRLSVEPTSKESQLFAREIVAMVQSMEEGVFVEIHASRFIADPLSKLLREKHVAHRVYATGVSLAAKSNYYQSLIDEEQNKRRLKDLKRERYGVLSAVVCNNPEEARAILERFGPKAQLLGVESHLEQLKLLLADWTPKDRQSRRAEREYLELLEREDRHGELEQFLHQKDSIGILLQDPDRYEKMKEKFGKVIAKYVRFLIKRDYAAQVESRIHQELKRMQIQLLKVV